MSRPRASRRPEVVVSGLGVVSPYGAGVKSFWTGLAAGTCAIKPITLIDTEGFRSRIAAEVPAEVVATLGVSRRRSRADRLALAAAREALADAGLEGAARRRAARADRAEGDGGHGLRGGRGVHRARGRPGAGGRHADRAGGRRGRADPH